MGFQTFREQGLNEASHELRHHREEFVPPVSAFGGI